MRRGVAMKLMRCGLWLILALVLVLALPGVTSANDEVLIKEEIEVIDGETLLKQTFLVSCYNQEMSKLYVLDCYGCKKTCRWKLTGSSEGGQKSGVGSSTQNQSVVDNVGFNYHHYTDDYKIGRGSASCGSCSSGASLGQNLIELHLERRHRYRNLSEGGSFGPGAYSNYDTRLFLYEAGGGLQMDVFDPREAFARRLVDGHGGDTSGGFNGAFTDQRNLSLAGARLLDGSGQLTTDLTQATHVEVEAHNGYVHRFGLIDLSSNSGVVSDDDLVGRWQLDEGSGTVASDASGNANTGTLSNGPSWVAGRSGASGDFALKFDGVDDVLTVANSPELEVGSGDSDFSVAFWVKLDQGATGQWRALMHKGDDNLDRTFGLFLSPNDNRVYYTASTTTSTNFYGNSVTALTVGQWAHVSYVRAGGYLRLYINGRLDAITPVIGEVVSNTGTLRIGNDPWQAGTACEMDDIRVYGRNLLEPEVLALSEAKNLAGRLVQVRDRNGYALDLQYKDQLPASDPEHISAGDIVVSPDRQWQIDTVTDAFNRQMRFFYRSTQASGYWVVEKIDLPNNQDIDYLYADDLHLTKVQHADGTESTISYANNTGTQTFNVTWDDASAQGTHRTKTAYLTNSIFIPDINAESGDIYNQSAMMIRMVVNGAGEVSYLNIPDPNGGNAAAVYEGAGRLRYIRAEVSGAYYEDGWTYGDPNAGFAAIQGTRESTFAQVPQSEWAPQKRFTATPAVLIDDQGRTYTYQYDADSFPTRKTYSDGTFEAWTYDQFKQVETYTDRLGRQTINTYDANGNLLTRKTGVINGVDQPEVATYVNTYYDGSEGPAVAGISGAASTQPIGLLKSSADANGNVTNYVYNANNFLIATIEPADRAGDGRATTLYSYDGAGRMLSTTDPLGRVTTYAYDSRDRQKTVTYEDNSVSEVFYGAPGSGDANLVVATKDRNGNYTQYRYDIQGRRVTTIRGITTEADALNQSFLPDTTYHDVEECVYLKGTSLKLICTRNGERTEYAYDFRHRSVLSTVFPRDEGVFPHNTNLIDPDGAGPLAAGGDPGQLVSTTVYKDNLRFASVDPYGRATFHAYRASDSALIRTVRETVPGGSGIDLDTGTFADVINLTRDLSFEDASTLGATTSGGGAAYLITDMVKDAEAQTTSTVDPRNIQHDTVYDSRGRATESTTAVGTPAQAISQTVYDAQSNVIEQRSARYFDAADTEGFNKAFTTMTYTGRNLPATRTVAAGDTTYDAFVTSGGTSGLGAKATQVMFYYLDGTHEKTVDFNGNDPQFTPADHETLSVWRDCCKRLRATIDQEGHGNAQGTDFNGNVAHTAVVEDLLSDVVIDGATGARTIANSDDGGPGIWDAPNTRTLAETTTRFDSKNRPVASTVWLETLGKVDPNDPPILYGGSIQGGANAQAAATGVSTATGG
ncbi:MAG: LamG-like jellyroll fold domain-containing protein, partial [Planctomycetota bacterium]